MIRIGFDLDHTLYDRTESLMRLAESFLERNQFNVPVSDFIQIFYEQSEIEYQKFMCGERLKNEYRTNRIVQTFDRLDLKFSSKHVLDFYGRYEDIQKNIRLRPNVVNFLKLVVEQGHELFILTNGPSQSQRNKLKTLGIEKYIPKERWYISDELNMTKPNHEIFKHIQQELGTNQIIYVGDDFTNDIEPSQNIGWKSIYLNEENISKTTSKKFYKVSDFYEIEKLYQDTNKFYF